MASAESGIYDSRYHVLLCLSSTNKVFILNKLPRRSNGRVRERKQRGRAHRGAEEMLGGGRRARAGGDLQTVKISVTRRRMRSSCLKIRITDRWKNQKSQAQPGARGTRLMPEDRLLLRFSVASPVPILVSRRLSQRSSGPQEVRLEARVAMLVGP